ncbi:hypothetical protein JAAARDRAFT_325991 [Jaapia argillacea MUCL 33604]|uniref:Uncharacterized protein n=1 Tax=Jaapia argillacea MUCL 33604 TaxID=933084 RepID=A0A067PLJ3_9AGAM|nr:hypothetical protein JAAARDRAFT_325991 [Jaapia argillacea MUCL 33604]
MKDFIPNMAMGAFFNSTLGNLLYIGACTAYTAHTMSGVLDDPLKEIIEAQASILQLFRKLGRLFKRVSKAINKWDVKQESDLWSYLHAHSGFCNDIASSLAKLAEEMESAKHSVDAFWSTELTLRDLKIQKDSLVERREIRDIERKIEWKERKMPSDKRDMITEWMVAQYNAVRKLGEEATIVGEAGVAIVNSLTLEGRPGQKPGSHSNLSEAVVEHVEKRLSPYGFAPSRSLPRNESIDSNGKTPASEVSASEGHSSTHRSYHRKVSESGGSGAYPNSQQASSSSSSSSPSGHTSPHMRWRSASAGDARLPLWKRPLHLLSRRKGKGPSSSIPSPSIGRPSGRPDLSRTDELDELVRSFVLASPPLRPSLSLPPSRILVPISTRDESIPQVLSASPTSDTNHKVKGWLHSTSQTLANIPEPPCPPEADQHSQSPDPSRYILPTSGNNPGGPSSPSEWPNHPTESHHSRDVSPSRSTSSGVTVLVLRHPDE